MADSWLHPVCETDWKQLEPDKEPTRKPQGQRVWELCCFCADATQSGIYVRFNPGLTLCEGNHETRGADPR